MKKKPSTNPQLDFYKQSGFARMTFDRQTNYVGDEGPTCAYCGSEKRLGKCPNVDKHHDHGGF